MTPQTCSICRHERRDQIDRALLEREPFRNIAKRTGTSTTALHRHKTQHIPKSLALAKETAEEIQAGTLCDRLRSVCRVTQEILREARGAKNHNIALQAIGRIERQLELEARLLGELDDLPDVRVRKTHRSETFPYIPDPPASRKVAPYDHGAACHDPSTGIDFSRDRPVSGNAGKVLSRDRRNRWSYLSEGMWSRYPRSIAREVHCLRSCVTRFRVIP